ncbi:M15 family metallopeptidase [Aestuariivivens marinum]|uniref:M15 family metallopeptidase n=1 Tax=Aestuariivivens marinum TaxID=2913555 RepID=UPI001F55AAAB|nr:M15 family metallopeptidase [Aestuariivivens marinum]
MKHLIFYLSLFIYGFSIAQLPEGFVDAKTVIPNLDVELRYYGKNNFVGRTMNGYMVNKLILTKSTAEALKLVQEELQIMNLRLKVYDGYRPQRAVDEFMVWARQLNDTLKKGEFYPEVNKEDLFKEGYIASKSGHSRGSTVDLTIIDGNTGNPLDMGSPYDFFGPISWVDHEDLTESQKANRLLLQTVMQKHGFINYPKEWWHFTLRNELYPNTYFDFPIE